MVSIIPAAKATQALPELLQRVKTYGATNMVEASLHHASLSLSGIMSDPILSGFPFDTVSFPEIVYRIIKKGTVLERAALAKHLTPEAAFFFPSISLQIGKSRELLMTAIEEIFKPMFRRLTEHFGVNFSGDPESVAYTLISEFGGLSFADFLICFERVKSGRYLRETQHIMTRGINYEFMVGWINQYIDEKEIAGSEIYKQFKPDNIAGGHGNPETASNLKAIRKKSEQVALTRVETERKATDIFNEWENDLYENGVIRQWFKWQAIEINDLDKNGNIQLWPDGSTKKKQIKQEVVCDEGDAGAYRYTEFALRVPKPGTIERKVKRVIYEFIAFKDSSKTVSVFGEYKDLVFEKYAKEQKAEEHIQAEFKIFLSSFGTVKREVPAKKMIEAVYRKIHPTATDQQISASTFKTISEFEAAYYSDYLPWCIENEYPRLEKAEYLIVSALPEFINNGFSNPFSILLR